MESARFRRLQELYLAALEYSPVERTAFLDRACRGDAELLRDIESLLHQPDTGILDHPALDSPNRLLPDNNAQYSRVENWQMAHALKPGERLSRYTIVECLGTGGMGAVFRAEDLRLGRTVAIKLMLGSSFDDRQLRHRFLREARALAALDHPHICTVYEAGEDRGRLFLVLAYVDGPNLSQILKAGPLCLEQTIHIGHQVAEGLAESHRNGIIHRDLKPRNILLTGKGTVKLVDFGLASVLREQRITLPGTGMGTPAYAAPEQWRGREPDPRADIWSLGIVLWEMLTGVLPPAGIHACFDDEYRLRLQDRYPEGPAELQVLLSEMLVENPDSRLASAEQVTQRLLALKQQLSAKPEQVQRDRMAVSTSRMEGRQTLSIAVLPFENVPEDKANEYFSDGITEELITGLSKVEGLRVVSRASSFWFKGKEYDPQTIGARLNVQFLVTGSVRKTNTLRLRAELITAKDGFQVWSEVYQREISDIFTIQEELAGAILETLKLELTTTAAQASRQRRPPKFSAYQSYLHGRYYWNRRSEESMQRAVQLFQRAIDEDPLFPQPYCGLADSLILSVIFGWQAPDKAMRRAKEASEQALRMDAYLAEAHVSLAMIRYLYDWDIGAATAEFRLGRQLDPTSAVGRLFHAFFLLWNGSYDEALKEIREAQESDPLSLAIMTNIGWFKLFHRKYEEAITDLEAVLVMEPDYVRANLYLGTAQVLIGRFDEGVERIRRAIAGSAEDKALHVWLAFGYAVSGRSVEACELLSLLSAMSSERYFSPADLAIVYAALGDGDTAVKLMSKAVEERCPIPLYFRDPRTAWLRKDPRVQQLLIESVSTD